MTRDFNGVDLQAVTDLHGRMGMDYSLPDLDSPLFLVRKVYEKDGRVIGACFLRLTAETYLLLDPQSTPREKFEAMMEMQPEVVSEAYSKGLDDIQAAIPETIQRKFYKRLIQLGWEKSREGWNCWSRNLR